MELMKIGYAKEDAERLFSAIASQNTLVGYPESAGEMPVFIEKLGVSMDTIQKRLQHAGYSEKESERLIKGKNAQALMILLQKRD